jgi:transcriptional regulatory protein RtcR
MIDSEDLAFLKMGIDTVNEPCKRLMRRIGEAALCSSEPILLKGASGTGKTALAERIYRIKERRRLVCGPLITADCALSEGENLAAIFTELIRLPPKAKRPVKPGPRRRMIFLDEVDALEPVAQKTLVKALETGRFRPAGGEELPLEFSLVCTANGDIAENAAFGDFRKGLLSCIGFWTFTLPPLRERPEDIAPNLQSELRKYAEERNLKKCGFHTEALEWYLSRASAHDWSGNFRDLKRSVRRLCLFAGEKKITKSMVDAEFEDLESRSVFSGDPDSGRRASVDTSEDMPDGDNEVIEKILESCDEFDKVQLRAVIAICRESETMASAGRKLFAQSRLKRGSLNDSDRLKKYLARFGLDWEMVKG